MSTILLQTLALSIVINMTMFIPAFRKQSDHYTDITYTMTFLLIAVFVLISNGVYSLMHLVLIVMIAMWSFRLGGYLRRRIHKVGVDHRFDDMRPNWKRYLRFWMIQGTSVWLIAIPFVIGLSQESLESATMIGAIVQGIGIGMWAIGFMIETIADHQKYKFRMDPSNEGKFFNEGLFEKNRHPNYLGEIMCWVGIFLFVSPFLVGFQWLSIISPLWIMFLLLFLSGIPMLEKSMMKRYGDQKSYQSYLKNSYKILPPIY